MTLLKQCFCYSLRQGSFIIGSYSLIVYCLAFAVELWWIVEALLILPAPAYTLCALYFFNFVMAAVLLFGLLIRQRKYLMGWSLMTVLSFFPECGMVLFMSLYYWPTHKYEYGVIELVYWSLRAIFNIFGALCVISLYLCWRDEELILSRLHDLTLASVESGSTGIGGGGLLHNHRSSATLKHLPRTTYRNSSRVHHNNNLGHRNYGYLDSALPASDHNIIINNKTNHLQSSRGFRSSFHQHQQPTLSRHYRHGFPPPSRSASTAAIFNNHNKNHHHRNSVKMNHNNSNSNIAFNQRAQAHANLSSSTLKKNEFNPAIIFDPSYRYKSRISDWGIAGIGIEPPGQQLPMSNPLHRSHSLWHVSNDEYWARPPPSRPVSMGYVNHAYNNENNPQQHHQFYNYDSNGESGFNTIQKGMSYCNPTSTTKMDGYYPTMTKNQSNWLAVPNTMNRVVMGRKSTSVDGLHQLQQHHRYYGQNILANSSNFMTTNQLAHQNNWSKSSLGQDDEDDDDDDEIFHNYQRDVAL